MTGIILLPDYEAIIGTALRDNPEITAIGANVAGSTPPSITQPWIRVTQLDAPDIGQGLEHLIAPMIQIECYAGKAATDAHGGQAQAHRLAATTRAVLVALKGTVTAGVAISDIAITGHARIPDVVMEPARERYILTVVVTGHAVPG